MDANTRRSGGFISIVVLILGAVAAAESGGLTTAGVRLQLPAGDHYQPRRVRFTVGAAALSVVVEKVEFLDGRAADSSDFAARPKGAPRQSVSTATINGLGRRILWTSLSKDSPEAAFLLAGPKGDRGRIVMHISGVDRIVTAVGGGYAVHGIRAGDEPISLAGRHVVCQSRADQHGVVISATGIPPGERMLVVPTKAGAAVYVPWRSGASGVEAAIQIVVRGVRGDAIIALEAQGAAAPDVVADAALVADDRAVGGAQARVAGLGEPDAAGGDTKPQTTKPQRPQRPAAGGWEFWTGTDRAFKPLLADQREASARLGFMYGRHAQKLLDAAIGGDVVVAERRLDADRRLTVSGRGLFTVRLNTCESSAPVLNSDYFGGVAVGYRTGDDEFELYVFHQSAHLGDEILESGKRKRIDYSRESIRVLWSHRFGPVRVYGGPTINVRAWPSDIRGKVTLQGGSEFRFSAWGRGMYLAADVQSRQENDWAVNVTGQYGIELGDPEKLKNLPRIFVEVFNGFSNMGQYFNDRETSVMLGMGYNF